MVERTFGYKLSTMFYLYLINNQLVFFSALGPNTQIHCAKINAQSKDILLQLEEISTAENLYLMRQK